MDTTPVYLVGALLLSTLLFLFFSGRRRRRNLLLPPTISGALPILGHLHLIIGARQRHQPLHRALAALSAEHGPILLLRFGSRPVLSISSPIAAEHCLTTNDITFSNRPHLLAGKYLNFDNSTVATASYGPYWRNLRRIATVELFSTARIQSLAHFRAEGIRSLLTSLFSASVANTVEWSRVEMKRKFKMLTFSTIMRIMDGRKYCGEEKTVNSEVGERILRMVDEALLLSDASSLEDFVPWMGWMGMGGTKRRMMRLGKKMDEIFQEMVDERRRRRSAVKAEAAGTEKTIVDVMLALQQQEPVKYSDKIIKGMISAIIIAGTETTAGTMEWALSLLLNSPDALQKARDEIDSHIGAGGHGGRLITDSDLPHLHHLQNIIKETLRLFPSGPLLLPHQSSADCTVAGYTIPSGTMLLINAYAIHRDPKLWKDAGSFRPERFDEGGEGDGFHFLPFGSGRRRCPGEAMAYRVMGLAVGALIQCFEWKRVNGDETVDLTEGEGLTMPKLVPLEALYKPREVMLPLLSQLNFSIINSCSVIASDS